jgi:hypothetical protein
VRGGDAVRANVNAVIEVKGYRNEDVVESRCGRSVGRDGGVNVLVRKK